MTIEPLGGGLQARCYRVRGSSLDCAVRLPAAAGSRFRLDARAERRLLETLAASGIAPPLQELGAEPDVIVTRFLPEASPWTPADARTAANIRRLAACLRCLHAVEAELEPLQLLAAAEAYADTAATRIELDEEQRLWRAELGQLAEAFAARFSATAVCHNDLVASNVLDDGSRLWLVDFEYAVLSEPILDLASVAAMNNFTNPQRAELVEAYYSEGIVPFEPAELGDAIRLSRLLAYFWTLAYGSGSQDARAFEAFAGELAAMLR